MSSQRGVTLIELMVALVIGMVIVLTATLVYLSAARNSASNREQSRMAADSENVFSMLGSQIRMAGFRFVRAVTDGTTLEPYAFSGPSLKACDGGFVDPAAAVVTCAGGSGPDAITIAYEAEAGLNGTAIGAARDCNGLPVNATALPPHLADTSADGSYFLVENRYYLSISSGVARLMCSGNGGAVPFSRAAPVAEGVEDFQVSFVLPDTSPTNGPRRMGATAIEALGTGANTTWRTVAAAEICLVLSSTGQVTDAQAPFRQCNGSVVTPADRRLRRRFTTDLHLRNQLF